MKALFVGDIHNHNYMFDDISKLDTKYNFDKIICFGDYVDDWFTDNHQSLETLNKVIELKKSNPNKYIFLLGNHENSYLGFPCSGHQYHLDDIMKRILTENINLFDLYTSINIDNKEYICTHSGICNDFIENQIVDNTNWEELLIDMNNNKLQSLAKLNICNYLRGGNNEYSSFLWADRKEHLLYNKISKPIIPYQIMGHTPVQDITYDKDNLYTFIYIDTHSTYRDGSEYGNKSYLIWNENKFEQALSKEL